MSKRLCLDEKYSTTRLLTQDKPEIINNSEDKFTKESKAFESVLFLPMGENRKGEGGLRAKGYFKKSYEDKPLISIITIVFNGEKYLEKTIQSVINQTYDNVEYIIIDGGSTDGTLDIIKKYEDKIDYWVSEQDNGIYDAMNKGITLVTGVWVNFMNAGDMFVNDNVLSVIPFKDNNDTVLIYGKKIQNGKVILPLPLKRLEVGEIHANHQSMFFNKRKLGNELFYDVKYKIYGDYELVNKLYLKYKSFIQYIDIVVADFEGGGISSKISYQKRKDKYRILFRYYGLIGVIRGINNKLKSIVNGI